MLYAYRVIQDPNQGPNERTKYVPADISVVDGLYSFVPTPYQELDGNNESLIGLPGVMVDSTLIRFQFSFQIMLMALVF